MSAFQANLYRVSPRRLVWPYSATRSLFIYDDCLVIAVNSRRAGLKLMASAQPNDPAVGASGGFGGADVERALSEIAEMRQERDLSPEELVQRNSRSRLIRLEDVERAELDQHRTRAMVGDVSDRLVLSLRGGERLTLWWPARNKRRPVARQVLPKVLGERITLLPAPASSPVAAPSSAVR